MITFTKCCGQLLCAVTGPGSLVSSGKETSKVLQKFMEKFYVVGNTTISVCVLFLIFSIFFFQIIRATAWPEKIKGNSVSEVAERTSRTERAMTVALGQCQNSCCLPKMAINYCNYVRAFLFYIIWAESCIKGRTTYLVHF